MARLQDLPHVALAHVVGYVITSRVAMSSTRFARAWHAVCCPWHRTTQWGVLVLSQRKRKCNVCAYVTIPARRRKRRRKAMSQLGEQHLTWTQTPQGRHVNVDKHWRRRYKRYKRSSVAQGAPRHHGVHEGKGDVRHV